MEADISSKNLDKSPFTNILGYQKLSRFLVKSGRQVCGLDDLLITLGIQSTIDLLYPVLQTFLQVTAYSQDQFHKTPRWSSVSDKILLATQTAEFILKNSSQINLKRFELKPHQERNSVFEKKIGFGPLYATFGYLPNNREHLKQFYLLAGQVLYVHHLTRQKRIDSKLNKSFETTLKSIRTLTKQTELGDYPITACNPEKYVERLKILGDHPQVNDILNYLTSALFQTRPIKLKSLIRDSLKKETNEDVIDQTDQPKSKPEVHEEPRVPSPYDDDVLPPTTGLIFGFSKNKNNSGEEDFSTVTAMVAKSRAMDNQMFHFAWNNLNQAEIEALLNFILTIDSSDIEDIHEVKLQLGFMLFFGMESTRLCKINILDQNEDRDDRDYYIRFKNILKLQSTGPEFKTILSPRALDQATEKQNHIDLMVPSDLANLLDLYLVQLNRQVGNNLFSEDYTQIRRQCSLALSFLKKGQNVRLTLTRIQNHIERRMMYRKGNDLSGASLTIGKPSYLSRTRIHYFGPDSDTLSRYHALECNAILKESNFETKFNESFPIFPSACLGTPIRPQIHVIQELFLSIKDYLKENQSKIKTKISFIGYHNAYTLYTILVIAYTTAFRANNKPFISEDMYDEASGFCVISDKTSKDYYHSRLVWLPRICRQQIKLYNTHISTILSLSDKEINDDNADCFFLSPEGQRQIASRTNIIKHLKSFDFHLPPNVQRHFLKSELQEHRCPSEIIEAFLGHWHLGEEPWLATSALHPWDYKNTLKKYLVPLLKRIGATPIRGLSKTPKRLDIPLDEFSKGEKFDSKKRFRKKKLQEFFREHPVHRCWIEARGKEFLKTADTRSPFRKTEYDVLKKLHSLIPELYSGKNEFVVDNERLQTLVDRLKPRPMHPRIWYRRMNFLIKGLELGKKQLKWEVEVPQKPVATNNGFNLARPSLIRRLKTFRELEKVFIKDLEASEPDDMSVCLGQVLISAILYGFINHRIWAEALVSGLQKHVFTHDSLLWVDLWAESPEDDLEQNDIWLLQRNPGTYRRWLADPTTQLLILKRWLPHQDTHDKLIYTDVVLEAYRIHLAEAYGYDLPSFARILNAANSHAVLNLPPYLAAYASNKILSASLPYPVWMRLLTGESYPFSLRPSAKRPSLINQHSHNDLKLQRRLLKKIRKIVTSARERSLSQRRVSEEIVNFLDHKPEDISDAVFLLGSWASHLLKERIYTQENRQKLPESFTTVYDYLGAFSDDLLLHAFDKDFSVMDDFEMEELFNKVTRTIWTSRKTDGQKTSGLQSNQAEWDLGRLNQFLNYLYLIHGYNEMSYDFKEGKPKLKRGKSVRSNYISDRDYQKILSVLGWGKDNLSRNERLVLVTVILIRHAGLRSNELHGLLVSDFAGSDKFEVLIRPNHLRGLKSEDAQRRIPLYLLLPPEELHFVIAFVEFRRTELGTNIKSPFFTDGPMENKPVTKQNLFAPIKKAAVDITGDDTIVPHLFRHTFTCSLLLRLSLREELPAELLPDFLKSRQFSSAECEQLRTDLLENESEGRKLLYAVAMLLGHCDTTTEIQSYFHFCDLLTWVYSTRKSSAPPFSTSAIMNIVQVGRSTAYERLKGNDHPLIKTLDRYSQKPEPDAPSQVEAGVKQQQEYRIEKPEGINEHFDQLLHAVANKEGPKGLMAPKSLTEVKILQNFYDRHTSNNPEIARKRAQAAAYLYKGYKHYCGQIFIEDMDETIQILDFLDQLDIGKDQMVIHHVPARWLTDSETSGLEAWEKVLNRRIVQQKKSSRKNLADGSICLVIHEYSFSGQVIEYDRRAANLLAYFAYMFANSHPDGRSILTSVNNIDLPD